MHISNDIAREYASIRPVHFTFRPTRHAVDHKTAWHIEASSKAYRLSTTDYKQSAPKLGLFIVRRFLISKAFIRAVFNY